MRQNKLLLLLALLMMAATGAWADTTVTWTASDLEETDLFVDFEAGIAGHNTIKGITVTASSGGNGVWQGNNISMDEGSTTITFTSSVGNIKSIAITAQSIYTYGSTPSGWTMPDYKNLSWSGDASPTVSMTLSDWWEIYNISEIEFTIESAPAPAASGYSVTLAEGTEDFDKWTIEPKTGLKGGETVTATYKGEKKVKSVKAVKKAPAYTLLSAATTSDYGKVVCAAGHLHDAKTAVPDGCTAVGIVGKVTETGHGLILALQNATQQIWPTINDWTSETTYAGTTLKLLPDDAARSTNLTSYTKLGETTVSNWAVAQKSDYVAIFENLGSTTAGNTAGKTYDGNVNAYITTGVGGAAISGNYWSATPDGNYAWYFRNDYWTRGTLRRNWNVRPVLGF